MGNIFGTSCTWFGEQGRKSRPFLVYQPTAIVNKPIMYLQYFNSFEGVVIKEL